MQTNYTLEYYKASADYIATRTSLRPRVGIVLGSCLGDLAALIEDQIVIDYRDIPNFLVSTVESHAGKLILGRLAGREVVCLSGRFHYYEGYEFEELAIPVRVLRLLGVEAIILTNAAGGVNEAFVPGDIMLIRDHIKMYGASPLRGPNLEEFGHRFSDVTDMYTKALRELAQEAADHAGVSLWEGTYFYAPGPQFETPAEVKAFRALGADAVGMSTVTEALTAAHCGMQVLAFSLITNLAAGMAGPVSTQEVNSAAMEAVERFQRLLLGILHAIEHSPATTDAVPL